MLKTIFFGTPETAVPFLRLLAQRTEVLAVVSQPDRPAGRGLEVAPTPVKAAALGLGLKVLQPSKPSEIAAELKRPGTLTINQARAELGLPPFAGEIGDQLVSREASVRRP